MSRKGDLATVSHPHLLPTYRRLHEQMRAGDELALSSKVEYQLFGVDRHGLTTWASPVVIGGLVGRGKLVAIQVEHERFVDRMGREHPGCPTALSARITVAIAFHPVGLPCLQCTVWLKHYPAHRKPTVKE